MKMEIKNSDIDFVNKVLENLEAISKAHGYSVANLNIEKLKEN